MSVGAWLLGTLGAFIVCVLCLAALTRYGDHHR